MPCMVGLRQFLESLGVGGTGVGGTEELRPGKGTPVQMPIEATDTN